jgi:hypothetical protein
MKRIGMATALAMTMLVSAGITRAAAQESVSPAPASPVSGGKAIKEKPKTTMTAVGAVKAVAADSLTVGDATGKDWTFVIDARTRILPPTGKEGVDVGTASPVEGGKVMPTTPAGKETVDVAPVSPIEGGKVIPARTHIKEGQRVQVSYHTVDGKMHATQIRVM